MSEATELLEAAEVDLQGHFPNTFTVDGLAGTFTGLLDATSISKELTSAGMRGADSAVLSFLVSAGYTPAIGDEVTAAGVPWKVASVRGGLVKWELALISDDQ